MVLTVSGWQRHWRTTGEYLHVWLDGMDVTSECCYADDEHGLVEVFLRDANGKFHLDEITHDVAKLVVHGKVEIKPGPEPQ